MALQSMTGFARREGTSGRWRWAWELRSVNGKGLDLRLRLPPGLERMEADIRRLAGESFSRGNLQASLSVTADENRFEAVLNRQALGRRACHARTAGGRDRSGAAEARHAASGARHRRIP
jgi:uncharacterized protein (TIGR00255 family)